MTNHNSEKSLVDMVQGTGNGGHSVTVAYAGPGGYKYSAPIGTLESLRRMGREEEAQVLASECFKSLMSYEQCAEAEKCISYIGKEVLDKVAYEILRKAISEQVEAGGNGRDKVDRITGMYLRTKNQ